MERLFIVLLQPSPQSQIAAHRAEDKWHVRGLNQSRSSWSSFIRGLLRHSKLSLLQYVFTHMGKVIKRIIYMKGEVLDDR
jgi:hypothetical protein